MKGQYVADIKIGDEIRAAFLLNRKSIREKKGGGYFLTVEFNDRTGALEGIAWDNVEQINRTFRNGDFVFVTGIVNEYNGHAQVVIQNIGRLTDREVDPADFLPTTEYDIDEMYRELVGFGRAVKNPHLKNLYTSFFPDRPQTKDDIEFVTSFKRAPAAMKAHHARIGGLLEHTLTVLRIARTLSAVYPQADPDLLLVGAALHDIGKIREYTITNRLSTSDAGKLIGHVMIGYDMVQDRIKNIQEFPDELAALVLHMILSHHGEHQWGSTTTPKFLEALILHFLDNLDSKVEMILDTLRREADSPTGWSDYHHFLEREIYLRERP